MINREIRATAKSKGIKLWEIANAMNISEATMTRKLRKELTDEEKVHIFDIMNSLAAEKANAAS